jgi:hypothetical protein
MIFIILRPRVTEERYTTSALQGLKIKYLGQQKYISRLQELKRQSQRHSNFWGLSQFEPDASSEIRKSARCANGMDFVNMDFYGQLEWSFGQI